MKLPLPLGAFHTGGMHWRAQEWLVRLEVQEGSVSTPEQHTSTRQKDICCCIVEKVSISTNSQSGREKQQYHGRSADTL